MLHIKYMTFYRDKKKIKKNSKDFFFTLEETLFIY